MGGTAALSVLGASGLGRAAPALSAGIAKQAAQTTKGKWRPPYRFEFGTTILRLGTDSG